MVQIRFDNLSADDCKKLALLNNSTRKGTPLESDRSVDDTTKIIEGLSGNNAFRILSAWDSDDSLVGWIYYYTAFPLMTFISGFYPVVADVSDADKITMELIEASKTDFVRNDHTRLEIELVFPTKEHRDYSKKLVDLYRQCGFQFAAEEIHMKCDLTNLELPEVDLSQEYTLRKFSEVSFDAIEGPALRTFKDSMEGLFLSMSDDEQLVTIKYFFDHEKPCIDDASLILERDGEVVGFIITRIGDDGHPDIGPVGFVPEARGQCLGSFLLVEVLKILKDSDSTSVFLDTTVTNHPAQKLYRKFGFIDEYYKQFYFWSP